MTTIARVMRGLGALALLFGVVAGVPFLLVFLGLGPMAAPSVHEVGAVLTSRDDGQVLRAVLAAGAWFCWLVFTLATAAEVWALIRSRPAPRLPGLAGVQGPVAALLAMVVVGLSVSGTAAPLAASSATARPPLPVAAAAVAVSQQAPPEAARTAPVADAGTGPEYVVQRRDTLWALADKHLGDPLRYPEIVALNEGRIGPDNHIVPGTALAFPGDAVGLSTAEAPVEDAPAVDIVVEPGDSLWTIAEDAHGDGATWPSVWEANAGRTEPGGEVFDDPDLIHPGWTLTVPGLPDPEDPAPGPSDSAPAPPSEGTPSSAPPTSTPSPPASPTAVPPTPTSVAPRPTPSSAPGTTAPSDGGTASESEVDSGAVVAAAAGVASVLGAVSFLALQRYRRRQFRHRRPGRAVPVPPPHLAAVERSLVASEGVDVAFLDRALRSLARRDRTSTALPEILAVSVSAEAVLVRLAEPMHAAPAPWVADAAGTRWSLSREAHTPDHHRGGRGPAPFPGLVSVGRSRTGDHWLLDLEQAGVLRIAGDPQRAADLLRYIAAELAHNTWSEMLLVDAVGVGDELSQLNPDRLRLHDSGDHAVTQFGRLLADRRAAATDGATDALRARVDDIEPDAWAPRVLLLGDDSAETLQLEDTLAGIGHRTGLALVMATNAGGPGLRATIDDAGVLAVPELGLEVVAHQMPIDEAAPLAQLLAHAAGLPDHAPSPGDAGSPVAAGHWGDGEPADETRGSRPQVVEGLVDSVLPLPDDAYLATAATTSPDVHVLAPATTPARREAAASGDPNLDRDLAHWNNPRSGRPKLTILGPVRVEAQGRLPERNPRRQFYTEVIAYLATRPDGATSEQYATALWPDEPDVIGKTKVRQSISVVRTWLGTDEDGDAFLPSGLTAAAGGRYRIKGALVDADLFRRLRARGLARGADGITDLHAALDLVRGRPFELPDMRVRGVGGYGWLLDDGNRMDLELAAVIVDVAHVVSTHHLGNGEPERAIAAAQVALRSGTYEDVPLLDLVAACDALGNSAEADAFVARILANHDAEVEEDLPPRTAEVLFRRSRR
ncbi:LysM peptidoglycan-binding domain-containing protein [Klenkia taihuensis]|uniref:LysM domain-containing protein n=1 Tax=Klenkia taihuensis TaxID=1225127 RepID=A0A1I1U7A7_9ACTN|nr:LysM peptidoglycan-binding domain-containing protein [Klenkia taihuensis]GHE06879.1 hypothetical protein GCM10011381_00520 [Klenkia taihuensis]SFD66584.1 LysM domain-containing protein [Klenkia taihuensis]